MRLSLFHRAFVICSSYHNFHEEILYLKAIFQMNSYPMLFMNKLFAKKALSYDMPPKKLIVVLRYLGKLSLEIRQRLNNIVSKIPSCRLQVIFRSPSRLRNIFRFKDVLPKSLQVHLVYKCECKGCNSLYYGKPDHHFHVGVCEHMGASHVYVFFLIVGTIKQ